MTSPFIGRIAFATACMTAALAAQAGNTVSVPLSADGQATYSTTFAGGVTANFSALVGTSAGKFDFKSGQSAYQGVGVEGKTGGEIDIGESINVGFNHGIGISSFTLGLLFDGPEYGDVNEKAKITATYADNSTHVFYLTATNTSTAMWTGAGSFVQNLSPATNGLGGVWNVTNPFGTAVVKSLAFTSVAGSCGTAGGACNNQTDYTLVSITAVPEPETYALLLAGLGLVGTVARRRKAAKSA